MEWMLMPMQRYAEFSGRSRRMEYWMFFVGLMVFYTIVGTLFLGSLGSTNWYTQGGNIPAASAMTGLIFLLFSLAVVVPSIAVQVRRFHDQDRSGWMVLLNLIPYIGGLIVLVFMFLEGTSGPNSYGPDPKATS